MISRTQPDRHGFVALLGIVLLALVGLTMTAVVALAMRESRTVNAELRRIQAAWLVQAGLERAHAQLEHDPAYTGEVWVLPPLKTQPDTGEVKISVERSGETSAQSKILVQADYPSKGAGRVRSSSTFNLTLTTPLKSEASP